MTGCSFISKKICGISRPNLLHLHPPENRDVFLKLIASTGKVLTTEDDSLSVDSPRVDVATEDDSFSVDSPHVDVAKGESPRVDVSTRGRIRFKTDRYQAT